ncbi:hypothetical protein C0989_012368 [Termitomyces sp. Mn162]|nr:hypothetical protein C0989_012368 [Termitomyces sp. Mn162]
MRSSWPFARLYGLALIATLFALSVQASDVLLAPRDESHHHNSHAAPFTVLNETEVTMYHSPTPESYYTIDFEGAGEGTRYEGSAHTMQGYLTLLVALSLSTIDILTVFRRIYLFFRGGERFTIKGFWQTAILGRKNNHDRYAAEYAGLVDEPEEFEEAKISLSSPDRQSGDLDPIEEYARDTAQWANNVHHHRHYRKHSTASEGTLFGSSSPSSSLDKIQEVKDVLKSKKGLLQRIGNICFAVVERFLVFAGLWQTLLGIVIYTGGCRENYVNGCLAHLIKGGIFWSYGLVTFARFLGSFAEYGWAWNQAPRNKSYVSAEFTESFVIFFYGATNTWMERFGAHPGDPYTTKQIQHIGIALEGMGIESKLLRKWLASSAFTTSRTERGAEESVEEPQSYSASFNPFPALAIGVTGAAMAAHAQTYLFQVGLTHFTWYDDNFTDH